MLSGQKQFEQCFNTYYRPLCLFALNYTGSYEASEDVVQQLFTELWDRSKRERVDITNLKSYLYTAVKNRCLKLIQQQKNTVPEEWAENEITEEDESRIIQTEREEKLWQLIDELPPERRKIFLMAKQQQMRYKEIAEQLHLSEKTVENQIGKALKTLRDKVRTIYLFFFG